MRCRHCQCALSLPMVDLGTMPPSNAYLTGAEQFANEKAYPLKVWVCQYCWLVQTEDFTKADELFTADYAYFSSTSASWLEHARQFATQSRVRLGLNAQSFVVELASNDGYLLKNYQAAGIPCLGIEPTTATANVARQLGLEVVSAFFGKMLAERLYTQYRQADLIIANNVLAHVPDINDFVSGISLLLSDNGAVSLEFPHLLNLLTQCQFDTIYHEHYSYLSLHTVQTILHTAGLRVFDVEQLPTHGGSLRLWCCHQQAQYETYDSLQQVLALETQARLTSPVAYHGFQQRVVGIATKLKDFLQQCHAEGKTVAAYGAAAKGNTLLNYAGIDSRLLPVVYDAAKSKQGKFLPGSHIPIVSPDLLVNNPPDVVIILPWNIADEIKAQLRQQCHTALTFVTAVPSLIISE
ncbi:class I SAM-dependent methyltransferase [Rheinheimera pacifica]|uniref:class I SAM-dependent methyltransferase n=1 Tax=Rheinheimera pacifica TaxID=173990 RepID=UPI0021689F5B|nr:class I SAM-dependent methyltransferase [Rheinheimera pacifica]